ncbi:MAG: putative peptide chain release factor 1 [Chlamydiota bacterium]|jgi:protein subunit release factor B
MEKLGIQEGDLVEKFILGSGKGGQKVNKTSSTVYLKHTPTGVEVKCQETRSREMNRFLARRRLCETIDEQRNAEQSARRQAIEKIRRQKRRRSKKAQEKVLAAKKRRSEVKQQRERVR